MGKNSQVIVCIIVIILLMAIAVAVFNSKNGNKNANESNINSSNIKNVLDNSTDANDSETEEKDNTVDNKNEVVEEDKNKYTEAINKIPMEQQLSTSKDNVYEQDSDIGTTDKKQQAINLVKETWGEDDDVTFSCDSIKSNGVYIIAVSSKSQARVLNYYKVDLDKKTVEVDY